jgi:hypothetical protein
MRSCLYTVLRVIITEFKIPKVFKNKREKRRRKEKKVENVKLLILYLQEENSELIFFV